MDKYLKYKQKYLQLKQCGGGNQDNIDLLLDTIDAINNPNVFLKAIQNKNEDMNKLMNVIPSSYKCAVDSFILELTQDDAEINNVLREAMKQSRDEQKQILGELSQRLNNDSSITESNIEEITGGGKELAILQKAKDNMELKKKLLQIQEDKKSFIEKIKERVTRFFNKIELSSINPNVLNETFTQNTDAFAFLYLLFICIFINIVPIYRALKNSLQKFYDINGIIGLVLYISLQIIIYSFIMSIIQYDLNYDIENTKYKTVLNILIPLIIGFSIGKILPTTALGYSGDEVVLPSLKKIFIAPAAIATTTMKFIKTSDIRDMLMHMNFFVKYMAVNKNYFLELLKIDTLSFKQFYINNRDLVKNLRSAFYTEDENIRLFIINLGKYPAFNNNEILKNIQQNLYFTHTQNRDFILIGYIQNNISLDIQIEIEALAENSNIIDFLILDITYTNKYFNNKERLAQIADAFFKTNPYFLYVIVNLDKYNVLRDIPELQNIKKNLILFSPDN